jgi:ABC-type Zn uptake system ZnuABC Zn-binding protein ZnuA
MRAPLLIGSLLLAATGCGSKDSAWDAAKPGPKVVVSFAPIYCIAANVAGPDAQVKNVMTTSGPHEFNPSDTDARLLANADVLIINGLDLDNAVAETMKRGSGNKNLRLLDLGSKIPEDKLLQGECHHDHPGHQHDHEHGHDPHIWLSPDMAITMTEAIRDELKSLDAAHAAGYDQRAAEFISKLRKLKDDGRALLKDKKDRKLVTYHESLNYFAKAYDLEVAGVVEKKPGVEPTIDEINALVKLCTEKQVRLIAVEPQYGTNTSAKAILDALKHKKINDPALVEIDPLETVTPAALTPDWYEKKMRANLEALRDAMK